MDRQTSVLVSVALWNRPFLQSAGTGPADTLEIVNNQTMVNSARILLAAHLILACPSILAQAVSGREQQLLDRIARLEQRLAALEARLPPPAPEPASTKQDGPVAAPAPEPAPNSWLKDTTVNLYFDGYYAWNTNRPLGRVNLLRAYDVTANNASINQTGLVIERTPDVDAGRRWGYRLDLMFGQATETLQGGAQNEPRPQVYRNLFQAYGTYVVPIGSGLTVDFGKWASALGPEGNYTKDQINYSRSYFFNALPFYHMGIRATYPVNDRLSLGYWLVNGGNQTEDFNEFKSQLAQLQVKPAKTLTWTLQYYNGREQREAMATLNPGLSTIRLGPAPNGRLHVINTYAFWNPVKQLTLGGEFNYILSRTQSTSAPQRITGGAAYLRYQVTPRIYIGQRSVRLYDTGGLFTGVSQILTDTTSTLGFRVADGLESRLEFRRDSSNIPFFLHRTPNHLARSQTTFTLGLLWWFGGKTGGW